MCVHIVYVFTVYVYSQCMCICLQCVYSKFVQCVLFIWMNVCTVCVQYLYVCVECISMYTVHVPVYNAYICKLLYITNLFIYLSIHISHTLFRVSITSVALSF